MSSHGAARVELVVKLVPGALPGGAAYHALLALATDLGVTLQPVDADASDPVLATYHVALVTPEVAAVAVARLRELDDVEAAYTRARGEPPAEGTHHDH